MHRIHIALLLLVNVGMDHARIIHSKESLFGRPISVYDRNCFFSPTACHFIKGRRAMTFITPKELEEEKRHQRLIKRISELKQ